MPIKSTRKKHRVCSSTKKMSVRVQNPGITCTLLSCMICPMSRLGTIGNTGQPPAWHQANTGLPGKQRTAHKVDNLIKIRQLTVALWPANVQADGICNSRLVQRCTILLLCFFSMCSHCNLHNRSLTLHFCSSSSHAAFHACAASQMHDFFAAADVQAGVKTCSTDAIEQPRPQHNLPEPSTRYSTGASRLQSLSLGMQAKRSTSTNQQTGPAQQVEQVGRACSVCSVIAHL